MIGHFSISVDICAVNRLGISTNEGKSKLLAAKQGLLAHLKKEDDQLYPVLNEAAEQDPDLRRTLDTFAKDMKVVSGGALEFFAKYAGGGSGLEFARDFGRLYAVLGSRVRREESVLYAEYDKLRR